MGNTGGRTIETAGAAIAGAQPSPNVAYPFPSVKSRRRGMKQSSKKGNAMVEYVLSDDASSRSEYRREISQDARAAREGIDSSQEGAAGKEGGGGKAQTGRRPLKQVPVACGLTRDEMEMLSYIVIYLSLTFLILCLLYAVYALFQANSRRPGEVSTETYYR